MMKVYGWTGYVGGKQTRNICAATSVAAMLRETGIRRSEYAFQGCETGNDEEVAVAMARPGVVFYRGLDHRGPWSTVEA